jgi:hypothetical protein
VLRRTSAICIEVTILTCASQNWCGVHWGLGAQFKIEA